MRLSIRHVCGIERADIDVSRIALITGNNGVGKSSIARAAGAVLTGQAMPLGMAKKEAALIVRGGATDGKASIEGGNGKATVTWPAAEVTSDGKAPSASAYAAGLAHIMDLDEKGRAKVLAAYLKTDPTKEDLALALLDADVKWPMKGIAVADEAEGMKALRLDPMDARHTAVYRIVEKLWKAIDIDGWDMAVKQATETGAKLKGDWERITGQKRYGAKVAEGWAPEGFDAIDESATEQTLAEVVEAAKAKVEATIRAAAVAAADLDGLRKLADDLPARQKTEAAYRANKTSLGDALIAWNSKAPPSVPSPSMSCPHCGCDVALESGALVPVSNGVDQDTIDKAKAARAEFDAGHAKAKADFEAMSADWKAMVERVNEALAAADKLAKLQASGETATEADVEKAKADLAQAEAALKAFTAKRDAEAKHKAIVQNQAMIDILAADGLRKVKLSRVLEMFNDTRLAPLCKKAGFKLVTIGDDLQVRYGGRLAREPLVSESEEMRARIIIQVAMAQLDGSAMVVVDRADKLDPKGRNGLLALLMDAKIPALVCMTLGKPKLAPDLAAAKAGVTYWVRNGEAITLADALAEDGQKVAA